MTEPKMTPTEELMMEVLVARYRLGEVFWPFTSNPATRRAANRLSEKGLADVLSGQTEGTFRAAITHKGIEKFTLNNYVPPILRKEK